MSTHSQTTKRVDGFDCRPKNPNGPTSVGTVSKNNGDTELGIQTSSTAGKMEEHIKKSTSKSPLKSLENVTEGSNTAALTYASLGRFSGSKLKSLKGNETNERMNGRNTIGYGMESPYRERIPSFTIHRNSPATKLQTHFAVYKFVPRHNDELAMNIGDAIHVEKFCEDMWYEGMNLKTGNRGVFPSRYVSDILSTTGFSREFSEYGAQFFLRFLGSVEVFEFKGNNVLCQAITKVLNTRKNGKFTEIPVCSLEIDHQGIRLIDHRQESEKRQTRSLVGRLFNNEQKVPEARYFFKLKDVTFCGCYPNSPRHFGFVTKHPTEHRFACHTFMAEYSTEPVAKAIGQAFKKFYTNYIEHSSSQ